MLNLEYILIGKLPETERDILLENLKTEREYGWNVLEWDSAKEHIQEEALAEKAILVSGDAKELNEAQRIGMAVLCYLMPGDGRTQRNEAAAGEMEVTPPADMYAEGMEEIDGSFLQHVYERHHHIPWIILKTPRCIVKEFSMEYLDALFELYAGKGMTDYMEPLYPYEEEREYQQAYIEQMYRFYGYGMWIVCDRNTGKLIGRAGVEHREELGGELELGYAIGVPWQRQGYATEVCSAILTYVKEELMLPSVSCLIEEGNVVSEHLAQKLGFHYCETVQIDGKQMRKYKVAFY